jgi:hypothetical protein
MSALSLFAAICVAAPQAAAAEPVKVPVRVVSVRVDSVYLDVGRDAGLRAGDRLRLQPAGGSEVEVLVLAVSAEQARVSLPEGEHAARIVVGTPGVAWVPPERLTGAAPAGDAAHPGWTAPPEEWSQDQPLLAPARAIPASERDTEVRGLAFLSFDQTLADIGDRSLLRGGVDLEAHNLFGRGGLLQLDVEGFARESPDDDESDSRARLERLSYAWGGERDAPLALEVGRFLQRLTPELGVLDGVESVWRLDSGDELGLSAGFLPEPTPEMHTGDDLALAAGWRHTFGGSDTLSAALALQKSWHEGESDRDLAVASLDWRPSLATSLHASAWLDYYDSSERFAEQGVELTEAHLNLTTQLAERTGASLFATHLAWPDTLRYEFAPATTQEQLDYDVSRAGLSLWQDLGDSTRLSGRADLWQGDSDEGESGELRVAVRDAILARGEVWLALFGASGQYTDSLGARTGFTRWFEQGYLTLALDSGLYEQSGFLGEQSELWQHRLRAQLDRDLGRDWDLGLWVDQRFGDELDATQLGFALRRRF